VKLTLTLIVALSVSTFAPAETPAATTPAPTAPANPNVRHIVGLETIKRNSTGKLTVQEGMLEFKTGNADKKVPVSAIDGIYVGTETTQAGGKTGQAVKTAAIAAPYESGAALTILMRTKVDILTVSFHDPDGAIHAAIFALPIGRGEQMRAQLAEAGAHANPSEK
jgi:hypothetical protein